MILDKAVRLSAVEVIRVILNSTMLYWNTHYPESTDVQVTITEW
jgi:hypothetical protein